MCEVRHPVPSDTRGQRCSPPPPKEPAQHPPPHPQLPCLQEMSLLEYEITECKHEGNSTVIRINSKPDVGAWVSKEAVQPFGRLPPPRSCRL
jgi:hypothetical protein